jgi:hypothetical protein
MGVNTYLVEIDHYNPLTSQVETLYVASRSIPPFPTSDGVRANVYYAPRVIDPGNFTREMFRARELFGPSSINGGTIVLANADGSLDAIAHDGFDGRNLRVLFAEGKPTNWSDYTTVMLGTMEQVVFSYGSGRKSTMTIKVRDRQSLLDTPLSTTRFLGDNALPDGTEGVEGDLKGKVKPMCFGKVFNITPFFVNTSKLVFQIHTGQINDVVAVYDRGAAITQGSSRASLATLLSTTPTAGQWDYYLGSGSDGAYIRLGSSPSGAITCDVEGDKFGGTYRTTAADIMDVIARIHGGIADADIDDTAITNLNTANSAEVGIYVDTEQTIASVFDELASSIGAWWSFTRLGVFTMGQFAAPVSTGPTIERHELYELDHVTSSSPEQAIPNWEVVLQYKKNYTVQSQDELAGLASSDAARVAFLEREWRDICYTDSPTLVIHPLSSTFHHTTLMTTKTDVDTEAIRILALVMEHRDVLKVTVRNTHAAAGLSLGASVTLTLNRFGYDAGKDFVITGIAEWQPRIGLTTLTLWG